MRHAQIENGVVVNVILVNEVSDLPDLTLVPSETAQIGDIWDGRDFTTPPPRPAAVPAEVTMRQARLALLGAGSLSQVQTAIDAMPSPQREAAQIEWQYSNTLQRTNPFVVALGAALGLTPAQIDALFIQAATL